MLACDLTGPYAYDLSVQALWVPAVADPQIPTGVEVAAGTDLMVSYGLTDIVGWEITTEIITDGVWGAYDEQRLGGQGVDDATLLFAADRSGVDIRVLLQRGKTGFVMLLPSGPYLDVPLAPVNCYPVRVAQLTQVQQLRTGSGSTIVVRCAVTSRPGENVKII